MESTLKFDKTNLKLRIVFFLVGLLIMALGISIIAISNFGNGPWDAVNIGLSEKTGLSERTIEKIEKGKVNTTAETLYTLINALDMSADYLFKMDKHQADVKCEQVINMLMACDENQKDVVCRTMQTLIEAMRGEKNP